MKQITRAAFLLASCALLSACSADSSTAPVPASTAAQTTAQTAAHTESGTAAETTAASTTAATAARFEDGFHFYQIDCPYVPAEDVMTCTKLSFPQSLNGKPVSVIAFQDEETLLVLLDADSGSELGTIPLKNGEAGEFRKLLDLKPSQYCMPGNERYIIITEETRANDSVSPPSRSFSLFDTETGRKGKPYWTASKDENGYAVGGGSFNPHLFIGNTVYFDYYSIKDGKMTATMYGYDIESGQITETYPECQKPMLCQGQLIGFTLNSAGNYRRLISVKDNGAAFSMECGDNLMSNEACADCVYAVTNEGEDQNDLSVCKLQNLTTGQSIITANAPLGYLSVSDSLIGWSKMTSNYAVEPALFDVQNQRLLSLDGVFDMQQKSFYEYTKGKTALILVIADNHASTEALLLKMR